MSTPAPTIHVPTHHLAEEFDAHGHKDHGHLIVSVWTLRIVLAVLLFFTLATSGAAVFEEWISHTFHVIIPQPINVGVALAIAVIKTALVVLFFMQLKYDNPLNSMIFIFTILTVAFFLGFTALDVGERATIDRFKAHNIYPGGRLDMGGAPLSLQAELAKVPTDARVNSIVDLSRFRAEQKDSHGHGRGVHAHDRERLDIITNAGYRRPIPESGSSEEVSRPVQGITLPEFMPAQPAEAEHHEPAAAPAPAPASTDKKPEAKPETPAPKH